MTPQRLALTTAICLCLAFGEQVRAGDPIRELHKQAFDFNQANWGHWGPRPDLYSSWRSHTNRLVPVYTFGISLKSYRGSRSIYRQQRSLQALYGRVPKGTLNPTANYFDQTQIFNLQTEALRQGKKYIFLIIFDGLDWNVTRAAATYQSGGDVYLEGRGRGLSFQDYRGVQTDFGYMVTAPHNSGTVTDANLQTVQMAGGIRPGGFNPLLGGSTPWSRPLNPAYLTGTLAGWEHPYTDSAAAASAMNSGIKTYNAAINVTVTGTHVAPLSRQLQSQSGFSVGAVTSVPISHATPACVYANNVTRVDYQDLTRDMLGLPSISHPSQPLSGLDVLIGSGWGVNFATDPGQGENFVPGNRFLTARDQKRLTSRYKVVTRQAGVRGSVSLAKAAAEASHDNKRLFGFFGTRDSHLPFQTADGEFDPLGGLKDPEVYTPADILENPSLADMTGAALRVLERNPRGFWLMVESGDVDWANHDNNLDNSIGAILSGAAAFDTVTQWIEANSCWDESVVIVAADHGHLFYLRQPEKLRKPRPEPPVPTDGLPR